jgi:hypothetical protein
MKGSMKPDPAKAESGFFIQLAHPQTDQEEAQGEWNEKNIPFVVGPLSSSAKVVGFSRPPLFL